MTATLRLFNSVLAKPSSAQENYEVLPEYGVVVSPSAMHALAEVKDFLKKEKLTGKQLNAAFYTSWKKAGSVTLEERLRDQLTHYFTTYGFEFLGIYDPDFVYLPDDDSEVPANLTLKVIKGVSRESVVSACLKLLSSGVALKQETIEDILSALRECEYTFTGSEEIRNLEAAVIIANLTGKLPQNPAQLFRFFVFQATDQTLVIKNYTLIEAIKQSGYALPELTDSQKVGLSGSYNRYKPLWLAFKSAHTDNRKLVNRLAKLSKTNHSPMPLNVLGSLTCSLYDSATVEEAAKGANSYQLIRAINALRYYLGSLGTERYYRIRNGKGYAKETSSRLSRDELNLYQELLLTELKDRAGDVKVYVPQNVDYALPVSEKMFSGNLPKNTRVHIPFTEDSSEHLLVGVHWEDQKEPHHQRVDLDLSAVCISGKVGWNDVWGNDGLKYSGDITTAPNGASEWLHCQKISEEYLVTLNGYCAPDNHPFQVIVGHGSDVKPNYIIDPNKVLFQAQCNLSQRQQVVGLLKLSENGEGLDFYLIDQALGNKFVSSYREKEKITQKAVLTQVESALRLRDLFTVVETPEKANVDLSLETLTRDSILKVFS